MHLLALLLITMSTNLFAEGKPAKEDKKPIEVFVDKAKLTDVFEPITYAGLVKLKEPNPIFAETTGIVAKVYAKPGQILRQNQPIFEIRPYSQGQIFQNQTVRSPVAGSLIDLKVHTGDLVTAKSPSHLALVASSQQRRLTINTTADDLNYIKVGETLPTFSDRSGQNIEILAEVTSKSLIADPLTGTFAIDLVWTPKSPEENAAFAPGTVAKVMIKTNPRQGFLVPLTALNRDRSKVYVIDKKGLIEKRNIQTGKITGKFIEIKDGLKAGETFITKSAEKPSGGEVAKIVTPKDRSKETTTAEKASQNNKG